MVEEHEDYYMAIALDEARSAAERGEVPVGALLVDGNGDILARDGNRSIELHDPSAHAEILVLRRAGVKKGNYRLSDTTLYVTVEPCVMCAGALVHARVNRLVFGADDPKAGGVVSRYQVGIDKKLNHFLLVEGGVLADECSSLLSAFFRERRKKEK
ncbi:MAG: tRNA adenosine(34) deaminase TadA [Pseudomonadota bacterium]